MSVPLTAGGPTGRGALCPPLPALGRPGRRSEPAKIAQYRARSAEVRACRYDGTPEQGQAIRRWVGQSSLCRAEVRSGLCDCEVVIHPAGPVLLLLTVRAGEVLVLSRQGQTWAVYSQAQFAAWFKPQTRELPIFPDGEVAE